MKKKLVKRKRPAKSQTFEPLEEAAPPIDSRKHILDCAARLFRTEGYASTSMRTIADAAGMRAASLYHHFPSKEHIVVEVLNRGVQSVSTEVHRSVEALGPAAKCEDVFTAAVSAHLRSLLELQDYTSANTRIFGQIPGHVREATLDVRAQYERFWTELLQRCVRQGVFRSKPDIHLLRLFLIGSMNSTLEWYQQEGKHSVEEIAGELARLFLRGSGAKLRT